MALVSVLALGLVAGVFAMPASARDIVIGDSSTPLSAGPAGQNFANTAVTAGSPAATQSGNCATPNVSVRNSASPEGPTAATDVRNAIQKAVTPAQMNVQAGDNVYFCNISQSGTGAPATNTYAPAEAGTTNRAVDLSVSPGITIAAFPGQTPILRANADPADTEYSFFADTNSQGREFTLRDLVLEQGPISSVSGGFIRISNAVTPGELTVNGITADDFEVNSGASPGPDGGVIAAESVEVINSSFGTQDDNSTSGNGGAIVADGDVLVRGSRFGSREQSSVNQAQADGGAVSAGGDVVVEGSVFEGNQAFADGGAIAARGRVEVTGTPSIFIGYSGGFSAGDDGGAIYAQSVLVANASRFGVDTAPDPDVGVGLEADGNGGAIATYNDTAGCNDASPATPCVPGVVEITGAATFGDNVADGSGGAIHAAGGMNLNGQTSGVRFISTANFVNEATGGGAIALGGLFNGANTGPSPRSCVASSSLTNLNFTNQKATGAAGGGAVHVLASATDQTDPTKRCNVGLTGNTFTSNNANSGRGGALFIGGGNVSVTGTTFNSNTTTTSGDGGAVATGGDATNATRFPVTTISGSTFTNNQSATRGGAIANGVSNANTSQTTISDTVFTGNGAADGGGGLSSVGPGSVTVSQSAFTENTAGTTGSGGAILVSGAAGATIGSSEFLRNRAGTDSGNGGAISITTGSTTRTITGNTFASNTANGTAGGSGGAIYTQVVNPPAASFSDNLFTGNAASVVGGAILHQAAGSLDITESTFRANYALVSGGALASTSGTLTVTNTDFESNGSQGDGGALLGSGTRTVLDGANFLGNRAGVDSLNAFVAGGNGADGGAAKISTGTYRITGAVFSGNQAANNGGGVDAFANGSAAGDGVTGSRFSANRAGAANAAQTSVGGGLNLSGASSQNVTTSEFILNEATQTNTGAAAVTRGGAIAATGGNLDLSRSTVAGNTAASAAIGAPGGLAAAGGGVYLASGNTVTSTNSTFTANRAPAAAVAWSENTAGALTFTSSTIASNLAPPGSSILVSGRTAAGAINLTNSVLAEGPDSGSGCLTGTGGTLVSGGGNVLTDTTTCGGDTFLGGGGAPAARVTSAQLALGSLSDNGGPTETMALGLTSIARNSAGVNQLGASPRDQRGLARPSTNQSSGAYQLVIGDLTVSLAGSGQGTISSAPSGIDCGATCRSTFALNSDPGQVTLTATPAAGSTFQSWTGPCASVSGNQCVVDLRPGQPLSVTANFRDSQGNLTVSLAGNGDGRVTSSPVGIDCGVDCVARFDQGQSVTLTAQALGKSSFGGWSGACSAAGKSPTCTLVMDSAKVVTASFTQTPRVRVDWSNDEFRVPGNRTVTVGQVVCVNGSCEVGQTTARIEARGKTFRGRVQVNRNTFSTGEKRTVKVVVPKAAYKRLRKGRNSGKLKVLVRAEASRLGSLTEVTRSLSAFLRR